MSTKSDMNQLGVIFMNKSKKTGKTYFTGEINGIKVVAFLNEGVTKDGNDFTAVNIFESVDKPGFTSKSTAKKTNKKTAATSEEASPF